MVLFLAIAVAVLYATWKWYKRDPQRQMEKKMTALLCDDKYPTVTVAGKLIKCCNLDKHYLMHFLEKEIQSDMTSNNCLHFLRLNTVYSLLEDMIGRFDIEYIEFYLNSKAKLVTLACKLGNQRILMLLLIEIENIYQKRRYLEKRSFLNYYREVDNHNAFYFAICSLDIKLLKILVEKWSWFDSEAFRLEDVLSKAYMEIKINRIPLSYDVELYVESLILERRFYSKKGEFDKVTDEKSNTFYIIRRIKNVHRNIQTFLNLNDQVVDAHLFILQRISCDLFILKKQLKLTYKCIPWEEMEFCLIAFISVYIRQQEINLFYQFILDLSRIRSHLKYFDLRLDSLKQMIVNAKDERKLSELPDSPRQNIVKDILSDFPHFESLYDDYHTLRDIHSLENLSVYIKTALSVNSKDKEGQLVILRAIQVMGEFFKNTLESPRLSHNTSSILLALLPENSRNLIQKLRDSLTHTYNLAESCDTSSFFNIQNDIRKIYNVLVDIVFCRKLDIIKMSLNKLITSENLLEMKQILSLNKNFRLSNLLSNLPDYQTKEHQQLLNIVKKIRTEISPKTEYEEQLLTEAYNLLHPTNSEIIPSAEKYLQSLLFCVVPNDLVCNDHVSEQIQIKLLKYEGNEMLKLISKTEEVYNSKRVIELILRILIAIQSRIAKPNEVVENCKKETELILEFGFKKLKGLEDLKGELLKNKKNTVKHMSVSAPLTSRKALLLKRISFLKEILSKNAFFISETDCNWKKSNKLLFTLEFLVLDILSIMNDNGRLENNIFLLDDLSPLCNGKCLRNSLAHDKGIFDILPFEWHNTILINARLLIEKNVVEGNQRIGKYNPNISWCYRSWSYLDNAVEFDSILENQQLLFECLEKGDINSIKFYVECGAALKAIDLEHRSALHIAAEKVDNVEVIEFLTGEGLRFDESNVNKIFPIHGAALNGNIDVVKFLLKVDLFCASRKDALNNTPMHYAAFNGHEKIVKLLQQKRADVNAKNILKYSPIHLAMHSNHLQITQMLFPLTTEDIFVTGELSSLFVAANNGHVDIAKFLLEKGAEVDPCTDMNVTPLHRACFMGYFDVVQLLIKYGAKVNAKTIMGLTPLNMAIENGHQDIVKFLLKNKAYLHSTDIEKMTCLHYAVRWEQNEIVKILLDSGAVIYNLTNKRETPLHVAAMNNNPEIVRTLLDRGAEVNVKNIQLLTPLHLAAEQGFIRNAAILVERGAEPDAKGIYDMTPLHMTAQFGHADVAQLLLTFDGVNPNAQCKDGSTPLHLASRHGFDNVMPWLVSKGASVDSTDYYDCSALHYAVIFNHLKIVRYLLIVGANLNMMGNHNGRVITPLCLAAQYGFKDVFDVLLQNGANINETRTSYTPLHYAIQGCSEDIVSKLIKNGANLQYAKKLNKPKLEVLLEKSTNMNETYTIPDIRSHKLLPIHQAAKEGSEEVFDILLKTKCGINALCPKGYTPLHYAVESSMEDMVMKLLANGAMYNKKAYNDETPMTMAVQKEIVNILQVIDDAFRCVRNNNSQVIKKLKSMKSVLKIVIGAKNKENRTIFSEALEYNFYDLDNLRELGIEGFSEKVEYASKLGNEAGVYMIRTILEQMNSTPIVNKNGVLEFEKRLAMLLHRQENFEEAQDLYMKIYKMQKQLMGKDHVATLNTEFLRIVIEMEEKNYESALTQITKFLHKVTESTDITYLQAKFCRGKILYHLDRFDEAVVMFEELGFRNQALLVHPEMLRPIPSDEMIELILNEKGNPTNLEHLEALLTKLRRKYSSKNPKILELELQTMNLRFAHGNLFSLINSSDLDHQIDYEDFSKILHVQRSVMRDLWERKELAVYYINTILDFDPTNENKKFRIAALNGDIETVKRFLNRKDVLNSKDFTGRSALHLAVLKENSQLADLLLEHNIEINYVARGLTALDIARSNGNYEIVKKLLLRGASYNCKSGIYIQRPHLDLCRNDDVRNLFILLEEIFNLALRGDTRLIEKIEGLSSTELLVITRCKYSLDSSHYTLIELLNFKKHHGIVNSLIERNLFENKDNRFCCMM